MCESLRNLCFHQFFYTLYCHLIGDVLIVAEGSNLTYVLFINDFLLQVDCESDALLAADVSSSGELLAFGDSGGYVHVWGASEHALVNLHSLPTEVSTELKQIIVYMVLVLKVLQVIDLTFAVSGTNYYGCELNIFYRIISN